MRKTKLLLGIMMMMFLLVAAGCSSESNTAQKEAAAPAAAAKPTATQESSLKDTKVVLYYPNKMGSKLIASEHTLKIDAKDKDALYKQTLLALLQAPLKDKGIVVIPKGTQLLAVTLHQDHVLDVNFNQAFTKNFTGGSTNAIMVIGSIVDTMTQFKEISAVRFYVDGKRLETLGDFDLTEPVKKIKNIL